MDYFCQQCSAKPGWPWDAAKAFQHSCQRCFRNLPCNDYAWRKPHVTQSPAPKPTDLVKEQINAHSQVDLPRAKGTPAPAPIPVYEATPPEEPKWNDPETRRVAPAQESVPTQPIAPAQPPTHPTQVDTRNDADKALDAVQPNRPGIKLQSIKKP